MRRAHDKCTAVIIDDNINFIEIQNKMMVVLAANK